jgi:DNA-directed RNA polymerase specialized sigma24 family protein
VSGCCRTGHACARRRSCCVEIGSWPTIWSRTLWVGSSRGGTRSCRQATRAHVNRILHNLYADHRRRPARREISEAEVDASSLTTTATPGERDDDLVRALLAVPQGQRTVLILRFFEDLSVTQTADLLNTSAGNIKSQTSRGLKALRCALMEQQNTSEGAL